MDFQFKIEQIAIAPLNNPLARDLLSALGLTNWIHDHVRAIGAIANPATGVVRRVKSEADLFFNYQAGKECNDVPLLEFEILDYGGCDSWLSDVYESDGGMKSLVSHIGMHCTEDELAEWSAMLRDRFGVVPVQELYTQSHTNQYLVQRQRRYHYMVFGTRHIIGVDLKFIVRIEPPQEDGEQ